MILQSKTSYSKRSNSKVQLSATWKIIAIESKAFKVNAIILKYWSISLYDMKGLYL